MDPHLNPFAPGAGTPPPWLAGRDQIIQEATIALARLRRGTPERGHLLLGLRGVGKTVLLNRIETEALSQGFLIASFEAPENGKLAELIVPRLRNVLTRLSREEKAKALAMHGLGLLRGFASAFKVRIGELEIGVQPEPGTADSGNLEHDMPDLLLSVGRAATAAGGAVAILIDEVQYLSSAELSALIVSMHRASQKGVPVILFGAGLPQIAGLAGDTKSYAERLFRYPDIGPLPTAAAGAAIQKPIESRDAEIEPVALERIVQLTRGYPYFLQEWGYHSWNAAPTSPITAADVDRAHVDALEKLDVEFFRVRLDRLTTRERDYLRAMADLPEGPYRSGDIAKRLGLESSQVGPLRSALIRKGMIYSPQYGVTSFTVPMFAEFMRRSMPRWTPPRGKGAEERSVTVGKKEKRSG